MTDKRLPVVAVDFCDEQDKYEARCAELVEQGYILVSANCAAHGNEDVTEMFFLAVFALPKAMGRVELCGPSQDFEDRLAVILKEMYCG